MNLLRRDHSFSLQSQRMQKPTAVFPDIVRIIADMQSHIQGVIGLLTHTA
jgi:hypothetical protein